MTMVKVDSGMAENKQIQPIVGRLIKLYKLTRSFSVLPVTSQVRQLLLIRQGQRIEVLVDKATNTMTRRRHPAGQAGTSPTLAMAPLHDDGFCEGDPEDDDQPAVPPPPPKLPSDVNEPTNSDGVAGFDWNFGDFLEFDTQFERIDLGLDNDNHGDLTEEENGINMQANVLLTAMGEEQEERLNFRLQSEEADLGNREQYLAEGRISPTGGYINPQGENVPSPYAFAQLDEAMQQLASNPEAESQPFFYPMNRLLSIEMAKIARGRNFEVKRWKRTNGVFGFNYFLVLHKKKV